MTKQIPLLFGDILALTIITLIGFATHGETNLSFIPRMMATLLPLVIGWFLIAPWLGIFYPQITSNPKQLWRPPLAMLLATPMAVILRAALLNGVALPLFALVLGGSSALGMLVWRGLFALWSKKTGGDQQRIS